MQGCLLSSSEGPDCFADSNESSPWTSEGKHIHFKGLRVSGRVFYDKENRVLGRLAWGSPEGPQRREVGIKPLLLLRMFVKSKGKFQSCLFLWKSGLVLPRAAQIPVETGAITCPEGLSVRREKQQRRTCLSRPAGLS